MKPTTHIKPLIFIFLAYLLGFQTIYAKTEAVIRTQNLLENTANYNKMDDAVDEVRDILNRSGNLANGVGKLFNDADIIALNKVIPSRANKSYLGKTIINAPNNSIKSVPSTSSPLLQKVDNYIAQTNPNLRGQIGEEIAEELVKDMDGFVHYPCKLNGSDNGFDVVAIKGNPSNPTQIRIIESKPMNSGSVNLSVTVNKGTQMSDFWIDETIEAMRNSSDQNLIDIGNTLFYNRDKITKLISTIDKNSKEIILIKLDTF